MLFRIFLLIYLLLSFTAEYARGQFYEYGQNPGSTRWNQFSSEHYKLVYPRGLDTLAMDIANKLEYFYPYQAASLDHEHDLMPVIIHNQVSFSNGVFVWAPKRMEIFTNPDPNGYPQDWLTQLAIHEGRHAFQVSKLDQGLSKALSYVAGEQAVGAITGFLPVWYLEGDAVDAETRYSSSGRGRLPSFEMGMKALLLEKNRYSYSKALFGSYRDYVPNHYELGYLMVRYGRRSYGDVFWTDFEDYAARKPFLVSPTYFSMRKYGIRSKADFYNNALDLYSEHWRENYKQRQLTDYRQVSRIRKKGHTNYHFPQSVSAHLIMALKKGIDQIPEFVLIDSTGAESRIFRPGYMNSGRFSAGRGYMIWDEWIPDLRWSNRNYSVIRRYNYFTGEVKDLGSKTRYYAPVLSRSEKMIAAVEQRTDQTFHLVVLDTEGNLLHTFPSPDNHYIQHPAWMEGDSAVLLTVNRADGEYLYSLSLEDGQWEKLFYSAFNDISFPVVHGSRIYFSSTNSGIDNIFCLDLSSDSLWMVTSSAFGAFEPSVSLRGDQLLYSDYHAFGYRAVSADLDPEEWIAASDIPESTEQLDSRSTIIEEEIIRGVHKAEKGNYEVRPYNKFLNSVLPHSWLPLYFDYLDPEAALRAEDIPLSPGFTIVSQNLLSTVVGMLAYEYKDKNHYLHTGAVLKGKFPVFDFRLVRGGLPEVYEVEGSSIAVSNPNRLRFTSSVYVPLRFNTGKYITFLQPRLGWNYTSDYFFDPGINSYQRGSHRFSYQMYFTSYLRMGRKDILPRAGMNASLFFRHAPFDEHSLGSIASYSLNVYIPGPLRHQTIKLRYAKQLQNPVRYLYGNSISTVRGMVGLLGLDMQVYSVDYTLPFMYPDLSIEPLIYIKRLRANLWADYLKGVDMITGDEENPLEDQVHYSYGIDLLADFHPVRFYFPLSMGARFAYLPASSELKVELLFNIDI